MDDLLQNPILCCELKIFKKSKMNRHIYITNSERDILKDKLRAITSQGGGILVKFEAFT